LGLAPEALGLASPPLGLAPQALGLAPSLLAPPLLVGFAHGQGRRLPSLSILALMRVAVRLGIQAMRFLIGYLSIVAAVQAPLPAFAYSCVVSPAKDSVIVKTDNTSDRAVTCKVDCTFKAAEGPVTISCSQQIPAGAKGWYVCLRPTGGKALEFVSGSESCK
jgi:hypothetical protein